MTANANIVDIGTKLKRIFIYPIFYFIFCFVYFGFRLFSFLPTAVPLFRIINEKSLLLSIKNIFELERTLMIVLSMLDFQRLVSRKLCFID